MAKPKVSGPEFVRFFGPVLDAVKQLGESSRPAEVRDRICRNLSISDTQRTEVMSGGGSRFENQVAWARFYLAKAGYLDASKRGVWSLTDKGRATHSLRFDEAMAIFKQVHDTFHDTEPTHTLNNGEVEEETVAPKDATQSEDGNYRERLRQILLELPPPGFERLCQRLLREAGFEQVIVTGRSGDGGIDGHGVLQINPFVSFRVLFQCKRYAGSVSSPQVRDFRGAMMGRADKGIILTTGTFTADARTEALRDGAPAIELVDGDKMIDMFENLELGLIPRKTYDVDLHFFAEFQQVD
jgi:restriction system protein